jgi:hypothetical protein
MQIEGSSYYLFSASAQACGEKFITGRKLLAVAFRPGG